VTDNRVLESEGGLARIWTDPGATIQYYPMVFTSFWIERRLWGLDPSGYHIVNILLHAGSALLLWRLLSRLALPGAWLAAALFALHPVQVESVAWIAERKNVLSGVFYFASALAYFRFAPPGARETERGDRRLWALAFLFFLLALFSKTVTASLPAAILVVLWWKRGRIAARDVLPLLPFFAAGLALGLTTSWMEANVVRARGPEWDLSFVERTFIAGRALWFYLGKLLLPADLSFNYSRWAVGAGIGPQALYPLAAALAALALLVFRRAIGRGPLAAALFFGGTLFPALGFVNVYPMRYSFVADHFQYLACVGPFALLAGGVARALVPGAARGKRSPAKPSPAPAFLVVAAALFVLLAGLTQARARAFRDIGTLWADTLKKNPSSFLAHQNLGAGLLDAGRVDLAVSHLRDAAKLKPDFYEARCSLGRALARQGRAREAEAELREASRLRPDKADPHVFLGDLFTEAGDFEKGIASYEDALRIDPGNADAENNLGNALARSGKAGEALPHYRSALALVPGRAITQRNLANALAETGRTEEAVDAYREAIRLDPREPLSRFFLARTLGDVGRTDEAVSEYREVLRIDPGFAPARRALDSLATSGTGAAR
jgi:tetratricopeptide (TPR) repeat protein